MIPLAPILGVVRAVPIWAWALAAVLAWGAFQKHRATSATKRAAEAQQSAAVHAATAAEQAKARELEHLFNARTQEAADAYRSNLAAAQRAAATARTERDRLLQLVASASPASGPGASASAPGGADASAGLRIVLAECVGAVQTLAEAADADAARVRGLQGHLIAIGAASAPIPTLKDKP